MGKKLRELNNLYWISLSGSTSIFVSILLGLMFSSFLEQSTNITAIGHIILYWVGFFGTCGLFVYLFSKTTEYFYSVGYIKK